MATSGAFTVCRSAGLGTSLGCIERSFAVIIVHHPTKTQPAKKWIAMNKPIKSHRSLSRREFVKLAVASGIVASAGSSGWAAEAADEIPRRPLGRTGEKISILGLGGYHIGVPAEAEGITIIRSAIDRGVNFLDNSWDYHEGDSEVRMGKALRDGYRAKVILMTKIDGRTKAVAASQIDDCLQRLQTDHIDLIQFHEIVRMTDPERIFAAGGAMEAMLAAKQAGKIRFIGFTGHKDPDIHLHMLAVAAKNNFRFDAVQMPLNVMDAHFRSFEKNVVPVLVKDEIGVLGMKPLGSGVILDSNTANATECLQYAMNLPTTTVITGMDSMAILDQGIAAARTFKPLPPERVTALLARTATAAASGEYERFKTTTQFDGTPRNPQWTG
jgi:aryl-alcohol dehydrogenase-like predicted oxidoreductase